MTAAYDDDKLPSRRSENVKNNNSADHVPVDFNPQKITATNIEIGEMSENSQVLDQKVDQELSFSAADSSVESKTVNSASITGRCSYVDMENVAGNKGDENCTSSTAAADDGNSLALAHETCLMLRKQKNIEAEIFTTAADTASQETFSCVNVRNSIVDMAEIITAAAIGRNENDREISHESLCCNNIINNTNKSYEEELIRNYSELELSSTNSTSSNYNAEHKTVEEEDLNYINLTDENKSKEFIVRYNCSTENLIDCSEISTSVNVNHKIIRNVTKTNTGVNCNHECISESLNSTENLIFHAVNNLRDEKEVIPPQNAYRFSGGNIIAEKIANFEFSKELESFEDYDPECEISFHEAVRTGDAKSVEMLVARGVVQNIDEPDWNVSGDPPLLVAATNHSLPVLRALLSNGCDPGVRSPRGETALHRAIINGSPSSVFEIVDELLSHDCPSTVKEAGGGLTALHILTRQLAHAQSSKSLHHNFDIALKTLALLAKVGPVDAKDHQGRSALHLLASSSTFGNSHKVEIEPMIRTLLEAGADPALKNDRGETPLHEALECGALNTAFLLIPHTPVGITSRYGETPLHIAARKNQAEVVDSLLKRGENPSFQDAGGNTPLHLASARGFHHTVSLLVTSPLAQLEKTNDEGLTSLQVAAESGFVNAVKLLLKAGADPSQTAHYCVTTLHRHPDISVLINHELTRRRQLAA